jgi:hypothetical protein
MIRGFLILQYFCKMKLFIFLLIFLYFFTFKLYAQGNDNGISYPFFTNPDNFFSITKMNLQKADTVFADTTLYDFHRYLPSDSIVTFQYLGVPGMAFKHFGGLNSGENNRILRSHGFTEHTEYFNNERKFFNTNNRFTNLQYVIGSGKEQYLDVLHSQNVIHQLNISLNYMRLSSEGFLRRQFTRQSSFEFYPWYYSKNRKYSAFAYINLKNNDIQENGGLGIDSLSVPNNDLNLLSINLLNARNESRKSSGEFAQKIQLLNLADDTSLFKHAFVHKLGIYDEKNTYSDTDPENNFYPTIYYDSTSTKDILKINRINNIFKYIFLPNVSTSTSIYLINDLMDVSQRSLDTTLYNYYSGLNFNHHIKHLNFGLRGEYCFSGTNQNDFLIHSNINYNWHNNYIITFDYFKKSTYPDFMYSVFQSNHFSWYNIPDRINTSNYSISAHVKRIDSFISTEYTTISNYAYFNENVQPRQFNGEIKRFGIQLKNLIKTGNFGLESKIIFQKVNEETIINIPELTYFGTLFYQNFLFENALFIRTGVELEYISSFKGDKYMPAVRQFYIQNEIMVGNYPKINLFINFKIKTARIFLKVENLNSGIEEDFYYTVPHYPMPGRVFKLGINWMFFD